jgi:Zn-dependent protease
VDTSNILQTIVLYALPVLLAITVHEAAHGYVARHFGDDTAALLGRVTLNPIKHIDPVGTIAIPLILAWVTHGAFVFGYAKPVPVRVRRLRNSKRDMIWVALAGPLSNLAQTLIWSLLFCLLFLAGVSEQFFLSMCLIGIVVNVVMFALNLFPVPPLDGGRVLVGVLPPGPAMALARVEPWGFFIVMALVASRILDAIWMGPLMDTTFAVLRLILPPLKLVLPSF